MLPMIVGCFDRSLRDNGIVFIDSYSSRALSGLFLIRSARPQESAYTVRRRWLPAEGWQD